MKKYRLIEYYSDTEDPKVYEYDSFDKAANIMLIKQADSAITTYRIEEFEESITDRVKSYEDACKIKGERPFRGEWKIHKEYTTIVEHPDTGQFKEVHDRVEENLPPHIIALLKLETITAALNEGWKPDWEDKGQKKWYVSYYAKEDFFQAAVTDDINLSTPSRLYFKSKELAEYAAKQFAELYKQLLIEKF